jgi:hypothetical protein
METGFDDHRDDPEPIAMHEDCELLLTENQMVSFKAVMVDSRGTVGRVWESRNWLETNNEELYCLVHDCFVDFSFIEDIDPESYRTILEEAREEEE